MAETVNDPPVMTTPTELEPRLIAVETLLHELQCRLATQPPAPNWLEEIIGSCTDEPAFDEVIALGRACRASQPYPHVHRDQHRATAVAGVLHEHRRTAHGSVDDPACPKAPWPPYSRITRVCPRAASGGLQ